MTMTYETRSAMATLLRDNLVQPSLPVGTMRVFVYPEDDRETESGIDMDTFPTLVVQKGLYSQTDSWKRRTQSTAEWTFWLEIFVYLAKEVWPDGDPQSLVEEWQEAVTAVILPNPTINDTVVHIEGSDSGEFLFSRDGFQDWYTQNTRNPESYWGISFTMRVTVEYEYAENVGIAP